jgi:hypothetical protein
MTIYPYPAMARHTTADAMEMIRARPPMTAAKRSGKPVMIELVRRDFALDLELAIRLRDTRTIALEIASPSPLRARPVRTMSGGRTTRTRAST